MGNRLLRVAKADEDGQLIWKKSTLYKLNHLNRYPGLFIKIGGSLFVDLEMLDRIIESCRK